MEETPKAAGAEAQTEATPTNSNSQAAAAAAVDSTTTTDMHGFTSEELADMRKFFDANGGYGKVKSRLSNPTPAATAATAAAEPATNVAEQQPAKPAYNRPAGSITSEEFLVKQYFGGLARETKYEPFAEDINNGNILKEMDAFNIRPINEDGSINDGMVRRFLDLKAQTVAARQTATTPEMSAAPTVDYVPVEGDIRDMQQAMAVLQQDSALRRAGRAGHPSAEAAEKYMREQLNRK